MSQFIQNQLPTPHHNNQRLFSDYYLNNILPSYPDWEQLKSEACSVLTQLKHLYSIFTPSLNNEAQTEEDWIKPVLRILGYVFEVQAPLKVPGKTQWPDYVFYQNEAARNANKGKVLNEENLKNAFAVGDAKYWDRPLDQILKTENKGADQFTNKNPSYQISFYIQHSGLSWGVLTNGRHWRLYHIQTAHKLDIYYEVDLPALLNLNDEGDFLYFYAFFRPQAFQPGPLALEQLLSASTTFARGVSENLRQQVYDALRFIAQGFMEFPGNNLTRTEENYKLIYDNSLTLLYRLLFVLYAEARNLLPLQSSAGYLRHYSLHAIKNDIVTKLQDVVLPNTGGIWARLQALFTIIDKGSPPLNVTTFNGGLFDSDRHPFLERYSVGDLSLCRAIDKIARVEGQFVDYRDLAERHLGTIYEGLLEYKLQVATEPMVELKSSSKIISATSVPKKDIAANFKTNEVYLVTDRGERKLTGSYYTPDYIVKYMVDEALRPVLDAAVKHANTDKERIQAVLAVNVLDPAMGSGHFPVEVTEYIARYLVELGVQPEETSEADLSYWKRRVAQQCIYGVDLNPLAVDLAKLSLWLITAASDRPLSFLDHHLRPGNALIGSWLHEVTGQNPATTQAKKKTKKVQEAAKDAGQLSMLDDDEFRQNTSIALESITTIEQNLGATVEEVKTQEEAYHQLRLKFSEKYLRLANLGTAMYYDTGLDTKLWKPLMDYSLGKALVQMPQLEGILKKSDVLAQTKRFFHWELEFPDIFFDLKGNPRGEKAGFDVVIGNPPYVRQEQLGADKSFFKERYEVYHSVADLFVYFFAQGLRLLRDDGKLAYISSNTWLRANYATLLRHYLRTQVKIETIVDLGDNRVFSDAPDLTPAIQIVCKTKSIDIHNTRAAVFVRGEGITSFAEQISNKYFTVSIHDQLDTGWQLSGDSSRRLFSKLVNSGRILTEVIDGNLYLGVKTGLNDTFVISQSLRDQLVAKDPKCAVVFKRMLRGEDLRPWYQEDEEKWLICLPYGWTKNMFSNLKLTEESAWKQFTSLYPSLAEYLKPFEEAARIRQDKGEFWWELRPCEYYKAFEKPKIFWTPIGKFPRFSWDDQGYFINNSAFFLLPDEPSLLGILQSRACWFCITKLCTTLGERAGLIRYQQFLQFIAQLPIPALNEAQQHSIGLLALQITEKAKKRYEVRRKTSHRIENDLGNLQARLNQRLQEWWKLPFNEFRAEVMKVFKKDIPLTDRDDWEQLLKTRTTQIENLTHEIIRLEIELNSEVYQVFGLNEEEITILEEETKYQYGEW